MNEWIIALIAWVLIVIGTLGSILPFLPGLPVAWIGLLVYSIWGKADGITSGEIWGLVIFGTLTLLTILVDVFAPAIAAKGKKASSYGVWGAILGGLLGVFLLGPAGILLGPFIGAFFGELLHSSNHQHALSIAWASMFGLVIGSAFKLLVGTAMFVYFLVRLI